jgi:DNA polymerase III alpha subunit
VRLVLGRYRIADNSFPTKHVVVAGLFTRDAGSTPAASTIIGKPLNIVAREYADALKRLGRSSLNDAVSFYVKHCGGVTSCTVTKLYQEFVTSKRNPGNKARKSGEKHLSDMVYVLECHQLGLKMLPPSVNEPGPAFVPQGQSIRVPLTNISGLTSRTARAILSARAHGPFASMADFFHWVAPAGDELEAMIRVGALDEFGEMRTRQFWQAQHLLKTFGDDVEPNQGWLVPPPGLELLPGIPLNEPSRLERLQAEVELFGFAVSGHPLELHPDVAWDSYCPVNRLSDFIGQTVVACGLVVEQRTHHQVTGEPMKFLSLADWTGIVQTELFASTYRSYGLSTIRYPVFEVEARVEPFENGRGFSLRVLRADEPRRKGSGFCRNDR